MTNLLRALRRNPDAIALATLSVILGVGRQAVAARPASFTNASLGIHWVCVKPATDTLNSLRDRLRHLGCGLAESIHLPELPR